MKNQWFLIRGDCLISLNRIWQNSRNVIRWPADVYTDKENEATYKCFTSETDFSSDSEYDEFANEIVSASDSIQHFLV